MILVVELLNMQCILFSQVSDVGLYMLQQYRLNIHNSIICTNIHENQHCSIGTITSLEIIFENTKTSAQVLKMQEFTEEDMLTQFFFFFLMIYVSNKRFYVTTIQLNLRPEILCMPYVFVIVAYECNKLSQHGVNILIIWCGE